MRLIDVDKLLEQLDDDIKITSEFVKKSIKYDDYHDFDKSFAVLYMLKSYRAIVEDMKTAFDVEKVVEQLEKSHFHTDATFDDDGYCNDDSEEVVNLNEAIEIIKRGVIDEVDN